MRFRQSEIQSRLWWILGTFATLVLGAIGGGWAVSHFGRPMQDDRVLRLQINPPPDSRFFVGGTRAGEPAISPDGTPVEILSLIRTLRGASWGTDGDILFSQIDRSVTSIYSIYRVYESVRWNPLRLTNSFSCLEGGVGSVAPFENGTTLPARNS